MTLFPGSLACCGYDTGDSVELDLTSSDAYGYLQSYRGPVYGYYCAVLAWKGLPSGVSLSPATAPSGFSALDWYCWTNLQTPNPGGGYATSGTDFPCSNYSTVEMLSGVRFTVALRKRPVNAAFTDAIFEVQTTGPRIFEKYGASTVSPLSSSDALSSSYISTATAAGWTVSTAYRSGAGTNATIRTMANPCTCSGRLRSLSVSNPSLNRFDRPTGNTNFSLTSCNTPISFTDSLGLNEFGTVQATTLTAYTSGFFNYKLEWPLTISAARLVTGSSSIPLFAELGAGAC